MAQEEREAEGGGLGPIAELDAGMRDKETGKLVFWVLTVRIIRGLSP